VHSTHSVGDEVAVALVTLKDTERVLVFVAAHAHVGAGCAPQERQVKTTLFAYCPHLNQLLRAS
jgi:hypothetical protein